MTLETNPPQACSLAHAGAFAPPASVQPAFATPLALPRLAMAPAGCTTRRVAGLGVAGGDRVALSVRMGAAASKEDPAAREIKNFLTQVVRHGPWTLNRQPWAVDPTP